MDAATFVNKPVLRAMRDADRILESTKGTKFYKGIKDQIGRDLADVCIKNGILGKQCYIYCDIKGTGSNRQYNFLGPATRGMVYTDRESFGYMPYCVVLANLKQNEVERGYEAILLKADVDPNYPGRAIDPLHEVRTKVEGDDFTMIKLKEINVRHSQLDRATKGFRIIDGRLDEIFDMMQPYKERLDKFIHS